MASGPSLCCFRAAQKILTLMSHVNMWSAMASHQHARSNRIRNLEAKNFQRLVSAWRTFAENSSTRTPKLQAVTSHEPPRLQLFWTSQRGLGGLGQMSQISQISQLRLRQFGGLWSSYDHLNNFRHLLATPGVPAGRPGLVQQDIYVSDAHGLY